MYESYYEESVVDQNARRNESLCAMFRISAFACLLVGVLGVFAFISHVNYVVAYCESAWEAFVFFVLCPILIAIFFVMAVVFFLLRNRFSTSYDYTFVGDELRISKIFNQSKRKFLYSIRCSEVLQMGKVGSGSYERLKAKPDIKEILLTPNKQPAKNKQFFYLYVSRSTEKLMVVLECKEALFGHIYHKANRTALESDYQ